MRRSSRTCARWLVAALFVGSIFIFPTTSALVTPEAVDPAPSEEPLRLGLLGVGEVGWHPIPVIPAGNSSHSPDVAVNPLGNTVVAWIMQDDVRSMVLALHDGLIGVIANELVSPQGLQVAIDRSGNAFAVWKEWDGSYERIRANRYAVGAGWETPALIDILDVPYEWSSPIIVDAGGHAVVVWKKGQAYASDVWAKRYTVGAGWSTGALISTNDTLIQENSLAVAADPAGNVIAVWVQYGMLFANRYDTVLGWGSPTPIGPQPASPPCCLDPPVAVDVNANGDAVVVWAEDFATNEGWGSRVWANRFTIGQGWGRATLIEDGSFDSTYGRAESPRVAIDQIGHATAVWTSVRYDRGESWIFTNRFEVGAGWATAMPIKTGGKFAIGGGGPGFPTCLGGASQLDADANGNALVVWSEFDGVRCHIWASRYVSDWGWVTPTILDPTDLNSATGAQLSVDASGTATVVWSQHGVDPFFRRLRGEVWTSTYVPDPRPLALELKSPLEGAIVKIPAVSVTGLTEPGAIVLINGMHATAGLDGSFSIPLVLDEGRNVITVRASNAVWTTAKVSVSVTYVGPGATDGELATLRASILALIAMQAGLAVSAVTLFVLYWKLRRPPDRGGMILEPPISQDRPNTEHEDSKPRLARGKIDASLSQAHPPWNGWTLGAGPLRLTAKERILLHLLNYTRFADAAEVPPDLAQAGIAAIAGVDSRHFAQYIRPLVRTGLVRERTAHVKGNLHRRKVYGLTELGRKTAIGIRDRLRPAVIQVQDASGSRQATIGEVLANSTGSLSILDIVRQSIQGGVVELRR